MAAPVWRSQWPGTTDATGAWAYNQISTAWGGNSPGAGDLYFLHVFQDGGTSGAVAVTDFGVTTGAGRFENLAGTDNSMDYIGEFAVGGSTEARQHLWIGRLITPGEINIAGSNSTSEDLYYRMFSFRDASTGTTLASVIENGTAGSTTNSTGTSNSVAAATVQTLGPDRLAVGCIGLNDDLQADLTAMTGESGGDWTYPFSAYGSSSGTDGAIGTINAAMAAAGTISGGTDGLSASIAWGCVGFAIIGTTPSTRVPRSPGVDSGNAHLCKAWQAARRWRHGAHGILVPEISFVH